MMLVIQYFERDFSASLWTNVAALSSTDRLMLDRLKAFQVPTVTPLGVGIVRMHVRSIPS
jgi:hypothetical protein